MNRVLQDLRRNGLITLAGRSVAIENWEGLKTSGEFDGRYLHLNRAAAAASPSA